LILPETAKFCNSRLPLQTLFQGHAYIGKSQKQKLHQLFFSSLGNKTQIEPIVLLSLVQVEGSQAFQHKNTDSLINHDSLVKNCQQTFLRPIYIGKVGTKATVSVVALKGGFLCQLCQCNLRLPMQTLFKGDAYNGKYSL
jgi:hypothetical protein